MTAKDTSGPAFPHTFDMVNGGNQRGGMSLRQWYAGMAMQGILKRRDAGVVGVNNYECSVAQNCFQIADAMIEAGEK